MASAGTDGTTVAATMNLSTIAWTAWLIILGIVLLSLVIFKGLIKNKETKRTVKLLGVLALTADIVLTFGVPILATWFQPEPDCNANWKINISQDVTGVRLIESYQISIYYMICRGVRCCFLYCFPLLQQE